MKKFWYVYVMVDENGKQYINTYYLNNGGNLAGNAILLKSETFRPCSSHKEALRIFASWWISAITNGRTDPEKGFSEKDLNFLINLEQANS